MEIRKKIKKHFENYIMAIIRKNENYFSDLIEKHITKEKILHITQTNHFCWGDSTKLHISDTAAMVNTLFNTSSGHIYVGKYAFTGHHVSIITGTHQYTKGLHERQVAVPADGNDIWIGDGVWLGSNSVILGPNTIGDHAVIAAGAVVLPNTNVPSSTIYGGIPAKQLRRIENVEYNTMLPLSGKQIDFHISVLSTQRKWKIGALHQLLVRVKNLSSIPVQSCSPYPVYLSYHLLTQKGETVVFDGRRSLLPKKLCPGEAADIAMDFEIGKSTGGGHLSCA